MTKLRLYCTVFVLLLVISGKRAFSQYELKINFVDRDSLFNKDNLQLQSSFKTRDLCIQYVAQLPQLLEKKGFTTSSVDSAYYDSAVASIQLYIGETFNWSHINTSKADLEILSSTGWNEKNYDEKSLNFQQVQRMQQRVLNYMENNGYPFARISLDSISMDSAGLIANLKIDRGPLYKIDSVRVYGNAKISVEFLQHYLGIPNASLYKKEKLQSISRKILELPFVEEQQQWNLTLLGTGAVLNLYLKPKKSSQINVLVGFLPANNQLTNGKLLVTGEALINLKNSLGNGENILLNWQQIQVKSPRLDLGFQQPFLFNSSFGVNAAFDLFKKDSSYINISMMLGMQYAASTTQTGSVFIQSLKTNLLNADTLLIISTHQLPQEADISAVSLGLSYDFNNTNYRFNPQQGNELLFTGTVGTRKIKKNDVIEKLIDPNDSSFQFSSLYDTLKLKSYEFRVKMAAAHYFQLGRASTVRVAFNGGWFQSPNSFRNELFQIGGYKLLRGFDEESIFAAQYVVGTLEYRFLIGQNSFLFSFIDGGWAKNSTPGYQLNNTYLGLGLGLAFETRAGIFNISYAVGKRDDANLNLRQAKIHLGYVNFF